jgi:hypothetical protein
MRGKLGERTIDYSTCQNVLKITIASLNCRDRSRISHLWKVANREGANTKINRQVAMLLRLKVQIHHNIAIANFAIAETSFKDKTGFT